MFAGKVTAFKTKAATGVGKLAICVRISMWIFFCFFSMTVSSDQTVSELSALRAKRNGCRLCWLVFFFLLVDFLRNQEREPVRQIGRQLYSAGQGEPLHGLFPKRKSAGRQGINLGGASVLASQPITGLFPR